MLVKLEINDILQYCFKKFYFVTGYLQSRAITEPKMKKGSILIPALAAVFVTIWFAKGFGSNGTLIDGVGAKSMGMGGAFTAIARDTASIYHNPAGIARQKGKTLEAGLNLMYPRPRYDEADNANVYAGKLLWVLPQFGFVNKEESSRLGWGFGFFTVAGLQVKYNLNHAVFGAQPYESKLALSKAAPAIAYKVTPKLSLGAGLNIGFQEFDLKIPYVVQTGALAGSNVLVDIKTSGQGFGGIFGLLYEIDDKTALGFAYTTKMDVDLQGTTPFLTTTGLSAHYDVNIDYHWPKTLALGLSHKPSPKLILASDVTWIDWSAGNEDLILKLSEGTNADINALAGSAGIIDVLPLDWKDRFVFHFGAEYHSSPKTTLRAGYIYGKSPVPDSTAVPVLAAILEHTITLGAGYKPQKSWEYNIAYQHSFKHRQTTGSSDLLGGDYNNSKNSIYSNSLIFTISYLF